MKSKILVLSLVGITAGAFGTIGSRILAGSSDPVSAEVTAGPIQAEKMKLENKSDACKTVARKVSKGDLSDVQLKRLLKANPKCQTIVVDSAAPATSIQAAPRVVTLPATSSARTVTAAAAQTPMGDDGSEAYDDGYEDDEGYEDGEGDDQGYEDDEGVDDSDGAEEGEDD